MPVALRCSKRCPYGEPQPSEEQKRPPSAPAINLPGVRPTCTEDPSTSNQTISFLIEHLASTALPQQNCWRAHCLALFASSGWQAGSGIHPICEGESSRLILWARRGQIF